MNKKGFTLVELLIVIAIIAVLAIVAIISLTSANIRSNDTKRITDVKQMQIAMEFYWNENANFPAVKAGETNWTTLGESVKKYLPTMPNDPTGKNPYVYIVNPENTDEFYIAATLEKDTHVSLNTDTDGFVGKGWVLVDSKGKTEAVPAEGFDCGDPVYCVIGNAAE